MYKRQSHISRQTNAHETLVHYAFDRLYNGGFDKIKLEHMFPNKKRIDLIARRNGKIYGIECTTRNDYKRKEIKYKKYVDKLIFCVPERKRKPMC